MTTKSIEARMATAIVALAAQLTEQEIKQGWSPGAKAALGQYLQRLLRDGLANHDFTGISISRAADHWGVIDGPLLEELAGISNELRSIKAGLHHAPFKNKGAG